MLTEFVDAVARLADDVLEIVVVLRALVAVGIDAARETVVAGDVVVRETVVAALRVVDALEGAETTVAVLVVVARGITVDVVRADVV